MFVAVESELKVLTKWHPQSEWDKPIPGIRNGAQRPRSAADGALLPAGPRYRNVGLFQVQKKTEEKCSHWNGDGAAGQPEPRLAGGNLHHDRWGPL